jgi:hypothetical protein
MDYEYDIIVLFQIGNCPMSLSNIEYIIYDENLKYFNLDLTDKRLIHNKTLLAYSWSMGGASTKVADFISNEIEGYNKYIKNQELYETFKQK